MMEEKRGGVKGEQETQNSSLDSHMASGQHDGYAGVTELDCQDLNYSSVTQKLRDFRKIT
jgi:hypothetical protein